MSEFMNPLLASVGSLSVRPTTVGQPCPNIEVRF